MNITVFAAGSRGDIQPCVALSKGLQQAKRELLIIPHTFSLPPMIRADLKKTDRLISSTTKDEIMRAQFTSSPSNPRWLRFSG